MAERLTQAQLARALDVSRQAIHKLVKEGKLVLGDDDLIDKAEALAAVSHLRIDSKAAQAAAPAAAPAHAAESVPATHVSIPAQATQFLGNADEHGMPTNYHIARTLREAEEARMARLKREEMEGQLIRVSAVESAWAASLAATREHLLQLRSRLTPLLAAETDPFKIDEMLGKEHAQALQLLAGCSLATPAGEGAT